MKRRDFITTSTAGVIGISSLASAPGILQALAPAPAPDVVRVSNGEPAQLLHAALDAFGGMKKFISKGDIVVVKPNMSWDRIPEQAANTNPDLVSEVVQACFDAGAKKVKIFDRTCNNPQRCYVNSRIEKIAKSVGADVSHIRMQKFKNLRLPNGERLKQWPIYRDYLEADKVVNLPIAKHHNMSRVTLGMKNLMGVMGGERGEIHNGFSKKLVDITSAILPTLTIIDAYRILTANGPTGGNFADVKETRSLIMSPCVVTADYVGLSLFDLDLNQIGYLKEAVNRGLNRYDLDNLNLKMIDLA